MTDQYSFSLPYLSMCLFQRPDLRFVPMIIYGAFAVAGAVAVMFLPETQGKLLPEHMEDVIGKQSSKKTANA